MPYNTSDNEDDVPLQKVKIRLNKQLKPSQKKITYKKEFCCVCLNNVFGLYKVTKKPKYETVNFLAMLKSSVPKIEWCSAYHICDPCSYSLIDSYTFTETCLNNSFLTRKVSAFNNNFQPNESINDCDNKPNLTNNDKIEDHNKTNVQKLNDNQKDQNITKCEDEEKVTTDIIKDENTCGEKQDLEAKEHSDNFDCNIDSDFNLDINAGTGSEDENKKENTKTRQTTKRKRIKTRKILNLEAKKEFKCENCEYVTIQSHHLVDHYVKEHKMKPEEVKPFKCHVCAKIFGKYWSLIAHLKCHDENRPFVCTYCGKGFKRDADLQGHEQRHLNSREYKCELCGKGYNTYKDLGIHKLAVHSDRSTWKWVCEVCSKPFPIKSNYDSHMRRHKGDKKFACNICPKRFTDKIVLQKHLNTHTNVRNFKCSECLKEYKEEKTLKVHMARIHSIGLDRIKIPKKLPNRYCCHICPKAFPARDKLTRHLYAHTGEKPFGCSACDKKFVDKSYAKHHERKAHGIENDSKYIVS